MAEVMKTEEKEMPRAVMPGSVLTIEVDSSVESSQEKEEARWHQLLNAQRTRKILTGPLSGIEKLESGWTVAVTYFNGYRIIIPMSEMMINLKGDGRENADTLNRQVRIANNMLGADIDFIIKDLDEASRSVVASRKDAMLRKRQIFYFSDNEEEQPMIYPEGLWRQESLPLHRKRSGWKCSVWSVPSVQGIWHGSGCRMQRKNSRWETWS